MPKHRTQVAFKAKREHITKVNKLNMAYSNKYIDVEI